MKLRASKEGKTISAPSSRAMSVAGGRRHRELPASHKQARMIH